MGQENEELERQVEKLKKDLTKATRELTRCREDKDELEVTFQHDLKEKEAEHEKVLKKEKQKLRKMKETKEAEIQVVEDSLNQCKEKCESLQLQLNQSNQSCSEQLQEVTKLTAQIATLEAEMERNKTEGKRQVERVEKEKEVMEKRMAEMTSSFQAELANIRKEQQTDALLFEEEKAKSDKGFTDRLEQRHQELLSLQQSASELRLKNDELEQSLQSEKSSVNSKSDQMERIVSAHSSAIEDRKQELQRIMAEKLMLSDQVAALSKSNAEGAKASEARFAELLKVTKDEAKSKEAELESRNGEVFQSLKTAESIIADNKQTIAKLSFELEEAHQQNLELQKQIDALNSAHERVLSDAKLAHKRTQNEKSTLEENIKAMHASFAEDLQESLTLAENRQSALIEEKKKAEEDNQAQVDHIQEQLLKAEKKKFQLERKLKDRIKATETKYATEKKTSESLAIEKSKLETQLQKSKEMYEKRFASLTKKSDEDYSTLEAEKDQQLAAIEAELKSNQEELLEKMKAVENLTAEMDTLNLAHITEIEDLQSQIQLLRVDKANFEANLQKVKQDRREATVQFEQKLKENNEIFDTQKETLNVVHKKQKDELNEKINDLKKEILEFEEKMRQLVQTIAEKESQITTQELKFQTLEVTKKSESEDLEREINRLKDEFVVLKNTANGAKETHAAELAKEHEEFQKNLKIVLDEKKISDSKMETRMDEITSAFNESQKQNTLMKSKLNEVYKKTETILKSSQRDTERFQIEKKVLMDRLNNQEELAKTVMESMKIEHAAAIDRLQKQLNNALDAEESRIEALDAQITDLERQLADSDGECKNIKAINEKSKLQISLLQIDKNDLIEAREKLISDHQYSNGLLKQQSVTLHKRIQTLRSEHSQEIKLINEEFKKTLQLYEESRAKSEERAQTARNELKSQTGLLEKELFELQDQLDSQVQDIEKAERESEGLQDRIISITRANERATRDAHEEMERLKTEYAAAQKQFESQKSIYTENRKMSRLNIDKVNKALLKEKEQIVELEDEIAKLKRSLEDEQKRFANIESQLQDATETFNDEMRKNSLIQNQFSAERQRSSRETARLSAEVQELTRQLNQKNDDFLKSKDDMRFLQFKMSSKKEGSTTNVRRQNSAAAVSGEAGDHDE